VPAGAADRFSLFELRLCRFSVRRTRLSGVDDGRLFASLLFALMRQSLRQFRHVAGSLGRIRTQTARAVERMMEWETERVAVPDSPQPPWPLF